MFCYTLINILKFKFEITVWLDIVNYPFLNMDCQAFKSLHKNERSLIYFKIVFS